MDKGGRGVARPHKGLDRGTTDEETDSQTVNIMPVLSTVGGGRIKMAITCGNDYQIRPPVIICRNEVSDLRRSQGNLERLGLSLVSNRKPNALTLVMISFQSRTSSSHFASSFSTAEFIEVSNKLDTHSNVCLF